MRTAYEYGYNVFTIEDCCCATSPDAHASSVKYTFPMFSTPLTAHGFMDKLNLPTGGKQTAFMRPSSVMHAREQIMFHELQEQVLAVLFFRGMNVAFTIEFIVAQELFGGSGFALALGIVLAADVALLTLAMLCVYFYSWSRSKPTTLVVEGNNLAERKICFKANASKRLRAHVCKLGFGKLLIVDAFVEGLKTALCLAFVTQPMSLASSASSASLADGVIGFDFNAVMTILCALLETAVNIYHGHQ